jgi:hypothetical protein
MTNAKLGSQSPKKSRKSTTLDGCVIPPSTRPAANKHPATNEVTNERAL